MLAATALSLHVLQLFYDFFKQRANPQGVKCKQNLRSAIVAVVNYTKNQNSEWPESRF